MTEEPDPKTISPTNHSPMPSYGPILTGPHIPDQPTKEGSSSNLAAPPSTSRLPTTSKVTSKPPVASRSASITQQKTLNKGTHKPPTAGVNQPVASVQEGPPQTDPTFVEDLHQRALNVPVPFVSLWNLSTSSFLNIKTLFYEFEHEFIRI
jgi:hypothetical protein